MSLTTFCINRRDYRCIGYIYETTNLINGKKYIGKKTSTIFLAEEYLGSGIILNKAIKKYGKENFKVKILEIIDTNQQDLCEREIYWINKYNAVYSSEYYNVGAGGIGWNNSVNFRKGEDNIWKNRHHTIETRQKMSKSHKGKPWTKLQREKLTPTRQGKNNSMYGTHRVFSLETRLKISNSLLGKRVWVNNQLEDKFISLDDLDYYLAQGYVRGRTQKFKDKVSRSVKLSKTK